LMSAINPTPQESFSSAGSNKPKADAFIVVLMLPAGASKRSYRGPDAIYSAPPFPISRRRKREERCRAQGRATLLGGNLCAVERPLVAFVRAAVRRALAIDGRPRVSSDFPTALCWSPIGTAMLSYAEHGKFHIPIQASARIFATFRIVKWIMGCAFAQWLGPFVSSRLPGLSRFSSHVARLCIDLVREPEP
jgi:hypothetical protein